MYERSFSLAFFLVWGAITITVIGGVWWLSGDTPALWFRFTVAVLAGMAALPIETELARRHDRRHNTIRSHRKTTAS